MSTQTQNRRGTPAPIFGLLAPGEKRTRKFPPLPQGVMPLMQNFPGGQVALVESGPDFVTVENQGPSPKPFTVLFVTMDQLQKLGAVKQVFDVISQFRKVPKQ